jgi:putative oxidoreductase
LANSEVPKGIFAAIARLILADQQGHAAKSGDSSAHRSWVKSCPQTRKEIAMEYEFKRNAVPGTSIDESRHVRGGVATQRGNLAASVVVDEPVGAPQRRTRTSSHPDSSTGSPVAAFVARTFRSHAPRATILVRLIVGGVFLTEGIQKFLFAGELGVGRFTKIGIPSPEVMAPFVGVVEIVGGVLLLVGLLTRLATIPLIIDMLVAIESTKIPILLKDGPWKMMHESRVDGSMLLGSIFLLIVGAGAWSLDAWCLAGTRRSYRESDASLLKAPRRREA